MKFPNSFKEYLKANKTGNSILSFIQFYCHLSQDPPKALLVDLKPCS